MSAANYDEITSMARAMRRDMLRMALKAGANGAHIGGSLSATEILAVLFSAFLGDGTGNHFILSKGHCVMAQYAAMSQSGKITAQELEKFEDPDFWLCSHATMNPEKNIIFSTGSLGQGLSLGLGMAMGMIRRQLAGRIFVLLGDGECGEGQVWEAAMAASHFRLANLAVIVDANGMQLDGRVSDILDLGDLAEKWRAFGWHAVEVDGHDPLSLYNALETSSDKPLACIARTIKGKGVNFMENSAGWHHGRLGRKQFEQAMAALEG